VKTGTGDPDPGLWQQLRPFLRPHRRALWASVALAIGGQVLLAMVPLLQKVVVDDVIVGRTRPLAPWIAVLLGVAVIGFAAHTVRRYLGLRLGIDVQHDLRVAIHHQLHRLDAARHDRLHAGDVLSRAVADTNLVQLFLAQVALLVANVTLVGAGLVVMAFLSPVLFLVVAATLPPLGIIGFRLRQALVPRGLVRPAPHRRAHQRGGGGGGRGAGGEGLRPGGP